MTPSISESSSLESINVTATTMTKRHESMLPPEKEERLFRSPKEMLNDLLHQVEETELRHAMRVEMKRLLTDHERLVSMLQQRSELLENENNELRLASQEHQRRYEKAVREMQFFKRKYELHRLQEEQQRPRRSLSIDSRTSSEQQQQQSQATCTAGGTFPLTPTSPQPIPEEQDPSSSSKTISITAISSPPYDAAELTRMAKSPIPPESSFALHRGAVVYPQSQVHIPDPVRPVPRLRQNSTTASVHSTQSSSTEGAGTVISQGAKSTVSSVSSVPSSSSSVSSSSSAAAAGDKARKKQSWQQQQQQYPVNLPTPSTTSISSNTVHSVPMTPVRSSTATNGYTGASLIQQRRVDPLIFGGSDGLWDTIAKSKGSDATVEKIISNFLRRGGSPNTAKQSGSAHAVKYGYGMIHALIVTKAPGSLDLLLQQGANPNVMTLSQIEDDKVTPCYLAAEVGWLTGLQKLVQAGGDLVAARGAGIKNKTALHVAAEHCHAAVVEYIVNITQGALNLEEDSQGATVLHYACASGHTDLVSFLAKSCQIPVNQPDHRGELPLHWAARHGRLEVVTLLVERCGCDVNAYVPRKVGTPLDLAKAGSQRRLVDYLKGLGALTGKKMDRRREEENENEGYLENKFAKNGFAGFFVGGEEEVDFF